MLWTGGWTHKREIQAKLINTEGKVKIFRGITKEKNA